MRSTGLWSRHLGLAWNPYEWALDRALTESLEDLEDVRDVLKREGEARRRLREFSAERAPWDVS